MVCVTQYANFGRSVGSVVELCNVCVRSVCVREPPSLISRESACPRPYVSVSIFYLVGSDARVGRHQQVSIHEKIIMQGPLGLVGPRARVRAT